MKCIDEVPAAELKGKRVIVPRRFQYSARQQRQRRPTCSASKKAGRRFDLLVKAGAKVIVLSHIGRDPEETLAPVAEALKQFGKVVYVPDLLGPAAQAAVGAMADSDVLLLENLRRDPRESENGEDLAKETCRVWRYLRRRRLRRGSPGARIDRRIPKIPDALMRDSHARRKSLRSARRARRRLRHSRYSAVPNSRPKSRWCAHSSRPTIIFS